MGVLMGKMGSPGSYEMPGMNLKNLGGGNSLDFKTYNVVLKYSLTQNSRKGSPVFSGCGHKDLYQPQKREFIDSCNFKSPISHPKL